MPYALDEHYHANVLAIKGRFLGSLERDAVQQTLQDLLGAGKTNLVVDLSRTDFMDSSGIGLLINGAQTLRDAGGDVRLSGLTDRMHGLFAMTRLLGDVFEDYPDVDTALKSFSDKPQNPATA